MGNAVRSERGLPLLPDKTNPLAARLADVEKRLAELEKKVG
jgi:hypothetical protein